MWPACSGPTNWRTFLTHHRGKPLASPALLGQMTERFVKAIRAFAQQHGIPIIHFTRGQRKDDVAKRYLAASRRTGRDEGVLFIGVAQENVRAFRSTAKRRADGSVASFQFYRGQVCVNHYYFYLFDRDWGPGRPDRIQLLFGRRVTKTTPSSFRTRVVQHGVQPKLSVQYKHSRLKQYFKEGRALRTETTINDSYDLNIGRSLSNLDKLRTAARGINNRLIETERTSHNCVIAPRTFESVVLPSTTDGQHVPGLRFGDPRVMAVLAALCQFLPAHDGFSNAMLRQRAGSLFDPGPRGYTAARMTYDLRRLRLKGIIERRSKCNRYLLTPLGRRIALFFAKAHSRIFRPGLARIDPAIPPDASDPLASLWRKLDAAIDQHIAEARMAA